MLPLFCISSESLEAADKQIYVLADIHVMAPSLIDDQNNKEWQKYLTTCKTMQDLSIPIFNTLVDKIIADKPDLVLIAGDLTKDSEVESHNYVLEKLSKIRDNGINVYVIPGNHDRGWMQNALIYKNDTCKEAEMIDNNQFEILYKDYGFGTESEHYKGLTYKKQLFPGLTLLAIDSGIWCSFQEGTIDWICEEAKNEQNKGNQVIVMMHHMLMPHYYYQNTIFELSIPEDYVEIRQKFLDAGIKVVLSGHSHVSDIKRYTDKNGNDIYDVNTGSLISYPCDYRILTFDSSLSTLEISTKSLTELEGYDDFPSYAKRRLKKSIINWSKKWINEKVQGTSEENTEEEDEDENGSLMASIFSQAIANCYTIHAEGNETENPESKEDVKMFDDLLYFITTHDIKDAEMIENISLSMKSVLGNYTSENDKNNIINDRELTIQMPILASDIINISTDKIQDHHWYTLQGLCLPHKPTSPGMYIYDGKVIIIK